MALNYREHIEVEMDRGSTKACASHEHLLKHAKNPVDLTKKGTLTAQRIENMALSALNLRMVYAMERIDDAVLHDLCIMAEELKVTEKMQKVQDMEVMNFVANCDSENRSVGHTAMRRGDRLDGSKQAIQAAKLYSMEMKKVISFMPYAKKFKHIVAVGIGGSYLGTKAIYHALKSYQTEDKTLDFISNVDPDNAASVLKGVELKKTLILIISKSGTTLEILSTQEYLQQKFSKEGLNFKEHSVCITSKGSPLDDTANYKECFYMWDYIGGRYSASSMVGAVPICIMLGVGIWQEFLEGLRAMDEHALEKDPMKNLPLLSALLGVYNRNYLEHPTLAVIPYSQGLDRWSAHLQQLFMESNGKHVNKNGEYIDYQTSPVIWGEPGTESQHSFFQCIHQGTDTIPIEFIGFEHSQLGDDAIVKGTTNQEKLLSNLFAQAIGLATGQKGDNHNTNFKGNRPSRIILAKKLDAYTMGNLLAYYEHVATYQGFLWGVNSFDQEGVQLGKLLANGIIDLYHSKRDKEFKLKQDSSLADALIQQFKSL